MSSFFSFDPSLTKRAQASEELCQPSFQRIDAIAEYNTAKVLSAFIHQGISESHFAGSSGYGNDDRGRDALEAVYAEVFGCEDALVRHNFVSGTHALTVALFGILRPGDDLVFVTGHPYDTLEGVLGSAEEDTGSLRDFGVHSRELPLLEDGHVDLAGIPAAVRGAKVAYIQRSRGYSLRPSLSVSEIGEIIKVIRSANPDAIVFVDNCYGEFVEKQEPVQVGADLMVGSMIKNAGGGIARTGGYIAGKKKLVEQCAYRLTVPGVGKELGCTFDLLREMYQGFFFAPSTVASALKTMTFASCLFEQYGLPVSPKYQDPRTDIIEAITLGSPEAMIAFCEGVQRGAPIDSFVTPEPWDMPGYDSKIIMAAGAFTTGSSIEFSADGPMREPYAVWMQGGLTYPSGKIGVLLAAQSLIEKGLLPKE